MKKVKTELLIQSLKNKPPLIFIQKDLVLTNNRAFAQQIIEITGGNWIADVSGSGYKFGVEFNEFINIKI